MSKKSTITVALAGGIGPEILTASLHIIQEASVTHLQISALYQKVTAAEYDIVRTETLRIFNGQQGFTLTQDQ